MINNKNNRKYSPNKNMRNIWKNNKNNKISNKNKTKI